METIGKMPWRVARNLNVLHQQLGVRGSGRYDCDPCIKGPQFVSNILSAALSSVEIFQGSELHFFVGSL